MKNRRFWWLLLGDAVTLLLVTLYGFASHDELDATPRMATTFVPLLAAWLLVGPFVGVFDAQRVSQGRQLWRPFWAMVLAAPLVGWLRGVMLNAPVIPLFVAILGSIAALALLAWRTVYWLLIRAK